MNVKGPKGQLSLDVHNSVAVTQDGNVLQIAPRSEDKNSWAMAGTMRALVNNLVKGVSNGFERKLDLVGVGYRAQAQGKVLNLTLGFSHPVAYQVPDGITIETPITD